MTAKTSDSITIEWTTDEPSNSIVQYWEENWEGIREWGNYQFYYFDPIGVTSHRAVIRGLKGGTTYYIKVGGFDASNNGPDSNSNDNNPSSELIVVTDPDPDKSFSSDVF